MWGILFFIFASCEPLTLARIQALSPRFPQPSSLGLFHREQLQMSKVLAINFTYNIKLPVSMRTYPFRIQVIGSKETGSRVLLMFPRSNLSVEKIVFYNTFSNFMGLSQDHTRLVCTHLNAYVMLNSNMTMKMWISKFLPKIRKILACRLHSTPKWRVNDVVHIWFFDDVTVDLFEVWWRIWGNIILMV